MMMPSILGENLFDDFMNDFRLPAFPDVDKELYGKHAKNLMKTDVKETEKGYEVDMDLPGFKKRALCRQHEQKLLCRKTRNRRGCTSEIRERNPLLQCSERGSKTSGRKEKLYFH